MTVKKKSWYNFRFRFNLSERSKPLWWLDILVIDMLFREIIREHFNTISLYRFHRRWMKDKDGHQLSLICYTDKVTFNRVKRKLEKHEVVEELKRLKYVDEVSYVDENRKNIRDTSDKHWNGALQKAWPSFANGISIMIFQLMDYIRKNTDINDELNKEHGIIKYYIKMEKELNNTIHTYGQHAFLHHLRGMFGYPSILVSLSLKQRLKILFTFKKKVPFKF